MVVSPEGNSQLEDRNAIAIVILLYERPCFFLETDCPANWIKRIVQSNNSLHVDLNFCFDFCSDLREKNRDKD